MKRKYKKLVEDCSHQERKEHPNYCFECIKSQDMKKKKKIEGLKMKKKNMNQPKENWEKEFWEIVEELGVNIVCFQKIRDFIHQDFISREKMERIIRELIKKDPLCTYKLCCGLCPNCSHHKSRETLSDLRRELLGKEEEK